MISDRCDFNDFVLETKGRNYQEIIYLAEQEATEAERRLYHAGSAHQAKSLCEQDYAQCLKGFISFMRYGIKPKHINQEALILFNHIRDEVQSGPRPVRIQH